MNHMFVNNWIVELFRKPSAQVLAQREYEEAQRSLLECQRMQDYYDNMVKFNSTRIAKLRTTLRSAAEEHP